MQPLRFTDPVYGDVLIDEPLLLELLADPAMQRLAYIDQAGYSRVWFPGGEHSRLEHSLGVAVLLARFGASLAEQAAGLVHDVSHTAFSHCVDYGAQGGSQARQSFQDDVFDEIVAGTNIPAILERHGLDPHHVLDDANFRLLERDLPELCADRIDYILRAGHHYADMTPAQIAGFLEALRAEGGEWFFAECETALAFGRAFMDINIRRFSGLASACMFRTVGDCLAHALQSGSLRREDLFGTDAGVLDILRAASADDAHLAGLLRRMEGKVRIVGNGMTGEADACDAVVVCKSRTVDPLCAASGGLVRASSLDVDYARRLAAESGARRHCLRFTDGLGSGA
jgi:HD superfamily phosphohydrolase